MFAVSRSLSPCLCQNPSPVSNSSLTLLLIFHLADGTQQMEIYYHRSIIIDFCNEFFPTLFSLNSNLTEVRVLSFCCFQKGTLPRVDIYGCQAELRHQELGPIDSITDVRHSRQMIGDTESYISTEKPPKLTVYPTRPCSFSEREMASGMFKVSISLRRNSATSPTLKKRGTR